MTVLGPVLSEEVCIGEAKVKVKRAGKNRDGQCAADYERNFQVSNDVFESERKLSASIEKSGKQKGQVECIEKQGVGRVYDSLSNQQGTADVQPSEDNEKQEGNGRQTLQCFLHG